MQLIDLHETAALFAVSTSTVRRWFAEGLIPRPIRIGTSLRWDRAELERFIQKQLGDAQVEFAVSKPQRQ